MKTFYLLPCTCGKIHEVMRVQAGNVITCECGKTLEVPPLRALAELETVQRHDAETPGQPASEKNQLGKEGGTRQQRAGSLMMAGILTVVFAASGMYFYVTRSKPYDFSTYSAFDLWREWQRLSPGVEIPMTRNEYLMASAMDVEWRWIMIMIFLTVVCVIWMLAVLLAPAAKKNP